VGQVPGLVNPSCEANGPVRAAGRPHLRR
jgi:hypothetical protein